MKNRKIIKCVAHLLLLALLIMMGWVILVSAKNVFENYTSTSAPIIVVSTLSGLFVVVVHAISKHLERQNALFIRSCDRTCELYEKFLKDFLNANSDREKECVIAGYQSAFAVNASCRTYHEFLLVQQQVKNNNTVEISQLINAFREELKLADRRIAYQDNSASEKRKHLGEIMKNKFIFIFCVFIFLVVIGTFLLGYCFIQSSFGVDRSNWLNAILSWLSVASAIFIGLIAYWQNERFKRENDLAGERTDKYQQDLVNINNRLIQIEENQEYSYLAFLQKEIYVANTIDQIPKMYRKQYCGGIAQKDNREFKNATLFTFGITNQTDVPVRCFEIKEMNISYDDFGTGDRIKVAHYGTGGFIPSPIIGKGEEVGFYLAANGITDLAKNLPDGYEIVIRLSMNVTSIYNRKVIQHFLLRLQTENATFCNSADKKMFWNYCFEADSTIGDRKG